MHLRRTAQKTAPTPQLHVKRLPYGVVKVRDGATTAAQVAQFNFAHVQSSRHVSAQCPRLALGT